MKFECPFCGELLNRKLGEQGSFLGCSIYPDCRFSMSIEDGMTREEIQEKLNKKEKIYKFLKKRHNSMKCDKCHGKKKASDFMNSLYHWLISKGYLTKKQRNSIERQVIEHYTEDEDTQWSYPLRDEITSKEEALLRRKNLW